MSPQTVPASPSVLPQAKPQPQPQPPPQQQQHAPAPIPWRRARIHRSNSDPVLMDIAAKGWLFSPPVVPCSLWKLGHQC